MTASVPLAGGPTRVRVEAFLVQQRPLAVCTKCLASALSLPSSAIHRAVTMLEGAPAFIRRTVACGLCGKLRLAMGVR